jgi:hypothetical protein
MPTSLKITLGSHSSSQRSASRSAAGHRGQAWPGAKTASTSITRGSAATLRPTRHCPGRWRGVVSLNPGPDGQRRRKKVSGKNKTEVRAKLAELHDGVVTNASYTVAHAIEDWLADGLAGRAPKTVSTQREVLEPLIDIIGVVPLRELSAPTVRSALKDLAATRATRTVGMTHAGLTRAIRHADADPPVPPHVDVWRSVRAYGDTKTSLHRWSKPPRRSSRDPSRVAAARPVADSPRAFSPPHTGQPSGSSRIRRRCKAYPW